MIKRTHSLAFRITLLSAAAMLCCILIIGAIGILAVKSEGDKDSARHMNLICDDKAKALNEFLKSVEQSAGLVARYAADDITSQELVNSGVIGADGFGIFRPWVEPDADVKARFDDYLTEHTQRVLKVFRSTANYTHGVFSFYYSLNPQFCDRHIGFWYARKNERFISLSLTDVSRYSEEDEEHTGWYYTPLRNAAPTWMPPYYNANLEAEILSYEIPVFKSGTFIGIVGCDINMATLAELIDGIRLFETGYAYLTMPNGEIVCHPFIYRGARETLFDPSHTPIAQYMEGTDGSGESTIAYSYGGVDKQMAFNTLANGMKLVVVAPSREINADWQHLIKTIVLAGLAVMAVFGAVMGFVMRHVTIPLKRLTEASRLLADGNYDVELDYSRDDEMGVLTEAFRRMTAHLKMYISDLNSRAYRDALTGVRNKGAFDIFIHKLNDTLKACGTEAAPAFAVMMLDCDSLKQINDRYGHEKGDIYLQAACRRICVTFSHSPVFRVGGDEFAVILQQEDFQGRNELLRRFDESIEAHNALHAEPWEQIRISKGIAVYDGVRDRDAASVFSRVDTLMYEEKKRHKSRIAGQQALP